MNLCYVVVMLGELYDDIHCYMMCYMVSSPLNLCGCAYHLRWSYNFCYMGVDVDLDLSISD